MTNDQLREEKILDVIYDFLKNPGETLEKILSLNLKWVSFFLIFIGIFSYVTSCSFLFFKKFHILEITIKWIIFLPIIYLSCITSIVFFDLIIKLYGREGKLKDLFAVSGFNILLATLLVPISLICKFLVPVRFLIYGIILFVFSFWIFKLQFLAAKKIYNLNNIEIFLVTISSLIIEVLFFVTVSYLFLLTLAIMLV